MAKPTCEPSPNYGETNPTNYGDKKLNGDVISG